jgi:DNA-binding transcriptional LysR family regulator
LKIFLCVYRENSITAAAKKLHISQPAVSLAIKEMEENYGVRLFERYARRLSVTVAGEKLYHYATHIIAGFDEAEAVLRGWDESGTLRLGSSITVGAQLMPQLVGSFQRLYPKIHLHITTGSSDQIERRILDNEIDIAVIEGTIHSEMIAAEGFLEDELGIFCGKSHPLANRKTITLAELSRQELLLREENSGTREYIESLFELEALHITPMWESTGTQTLVNAAAIGLGVTILPLALVEEFVKGDQLIRLFVEDVELKRRFKIIHHRNKSMTSGLSRFIQLCRTYADEQAGLCVF